MNTSGDVTPSAGSVIDPDLEPAPPRPQAPDSAKDSSAAGGLDQVVSAPRDIAAGDAPIEVPDVQIATPLRETSFARPPVGPASVPEADRRTEQVAEAATEQVAQTPQPLQITAEVPHQAMAAPAPPHHIDPSPTALEPPSQRTPSSDLRGPRARRHLL